jgi:hypothetical protein
MIKFITYTDPITVTKQNPEGVAKQYPIRVSYYALKMLKEELGRGLSPTDDGTDYTAYEALLFYALKKGHQKVTPEKEFTFKREQMEDMMDEVYFQFMKLVPLFFSDEVVEPKDSNKKGGGIGGKK